jgi:CrcB protein
LKGVTALQRYALVAFGGALGAMLRFYVGALAAQRFNARFPLGTLSINLAACLMIGFTLQYLKLHAGVHPFWRYSFATGFVGAFSTFSTFEWEVWSDFVSGDYRIGSLYLMVSLIAGILGIALGAYGARVIS